MAEFVQDYETFDLGDMTLQSGATLRGAKLAYKTFGALNADKGNAIVYPTWYSGRHWDNEWLIGDGMALDPANYFIIVPNMLGNGLSSVAVQHAAAIRPRALPADHGPRQGRGPAQARHGALRHRVARARHGLVDGRRPDLPVGREPPRDGPSERARSAARPKTSEHNFVFLEGVKAALTADAAFKDGWYDDAADATGLRAAAASTPAGASRRRSTGTRSTSRWATPRSRTSSSASGRGFFLDARDAEQPADHAVDLAERRHRQDAGLRRRPVKALRSIKARLIALPAEKDLYFPPEDEEWAGRTSPTRSSA